MKTITLKKCKLCNSKENLTIDHMIPLSRRGTNDVENLMCLCKTCNTVKSGATWGEVVALLRRWEEVRLTTKFLKHKKHETN